MQKSTALYNGAILSPRRNPDAYIDFFKEDKNNPNFILTPYLTLTSDSIVNFEIQRLGDDSKFYGFGVSQKATIKLLSRNLGEENLQIGQLLKIYAGVQLSDGTTEYKTFPKMEISNIVTDAITKEITITAYDALEDTIYHTISEVDVHAPYTLEEFAVKVAAFVDGMPHKPIEDYFLSSLTRGEYSESDEHTFTLDEETGVITLDGYFSSTSFTPVSFWNDDYKTLLPGDYIFRLETPEGVAIPTNGNFNVDITIGGIYGETYTLGEPLGSSQRTITIEEPTKGHIKLAFRIGQGTFDNFQMRVSCVQAEDVHLLPPDDDIHRYVSLGSLEYLEGANLEGTETVRDVLTAIAEVTQTIYFMGADDTLRFKSHLQTDAKHILTNEHIFDYKTEGDYALHAVASVTELGDNVIAYLEDFFGTGVAPDLETPKLSTAYLRDNPFLELREDLPDIVNTIAKNLIDNNTIPQKCPFELEWRGDPSYEPTDEIWYRAEPTAPIHRLHIVNDVFTYNGGFKQKTSWTHNEPPIIHTNPTNLGDALRQTYAKVDKQNKQITMVASETTENSEAISALQINTDSISASVSKMETVNSDAIESINGELVTLTKKVEATMTSEDVKLEIKSELSNGVDKVTTSTGFTFNEEGLTIAKSGSEMKTNIDEDGMSVFRDNQEVLTADNTGVTAYNLHARTYLIVGENSRFEDFTSTDGEARTGCFWIGG